MKQKLTLGIVAAVLLLWVVLPDPLPVAIDDIIAALAAAAAILKMIVPLFKKQKKCKMIIKPKNPLVVG